MKEDHGKFGIIDKPIVKFGTATKEMVKKSKLDLAEISPVKKYHEIEVTTKEANQYQLMLENLEKLDLLHAEQLLNHDQE